MNTEDFVTYEQAIRLKELGFDLKCHYHYDTTAFKPMISPNFTANDGEGERWIYSDDCSLYEDMNHCQYCSAPTLAQAQRWLREAEGIYIEVRVRDLSKFEVAGKVIGISPIIEYLFDLWDYENPYSTYESALSAGIDAALERI